MSEQLTEVTMTYRRDDGSLYQKTINGEEASKWKQMTDGVCLLAHIRGANPDWSSVKWEQKELESPARELLVELGGEGK